MAQMPKPNNKALLIQPNSSTQYPPINGGVIYNECTWREVRSIALNKQSHEIVKLVRLIGQRVLYTNAA
jgi:hypothetical protein